MTYDHGHTLLRVLLGRVAVPGLCAFIQLYLRGFQRYRFSELDELRETYRRLLRTGRPVLVCANHLTMIDSLLIHHALQSSLRYMLHNRRISWNVPAIENVKKNMVFTVLCYLGKTVPVDRTGSAEHHEDVLAQLRRLLLAGEVVTMFPEGGRSRTGRVEVDEVRYGIGKLLQTVPAPIVLCLYLRGEDQTSWGFAPPPNQTIHVAWDVIEPESSEAGRRGARALSRQVIETLNAMEELHFTRHGSHPLS